jgi:hypothetical protein
MRLLSKVQAFNNVGKFLHAQFTSPVLTLGDRVTKMQ